VARLDGEPEPRSKGPRQARDLAPPGVGLTGRNPEVANSAGGSSFTYVGPLENAQLRVVIVGKPEVASPVALESVAVRVSFRVLQPRRAPAPPRPLPRARRGLRRRTRVQLQRADPDPLSSSPRLFGEATPDRSARYAAKASSATAIPPERFVTSAA